MKSPPPHRLANPRRVVRKAAAAALLVIHTGAALAADPQPAPVALPDVGMSLVRLLGALALVLALFFGGVWLFRNWQRLVVQKGRSPKLNVLEVRSLGQRHALYVVAYEDQRMLLSASPTGVSLLSHLPTAAVEEEQPETARSVTQIPFAQTLQQMLSRS